MGNRLVGPITDDLKKSGFNKIINMASLSTFNYDSLKHHYDTVIVHDLIENLDILM